MKAALIVLLTFVLCVFAQDKYTTKYDNIDLDSIIGNDRLFKNYIDCLLDKGKCTSDAAELKKHIPDALESECEKCSEKQRNGIRKVIKHLAENKKRLVERTDQQVRSRSIPLTVSEYKGAMQFVVLFAVMFASVLCQNTYTSKYDSIDLDTVLTNDRLLKNYVDCLLDRGNLPESILGPFDL
ncbi:hypothetical protein NQ318_003937 [Aromia moschata]|uniref:Chemosensory protein n=1 Tax=Aromia moschata TaxID=1265417 RepID=A0AAV8Z7E8_9CUCU|nr:hypothetical protein NQ318_003937 [Aromia moschata]